MNEASPLSSLLGVSTSKDEERILAKSMNVVKFLAKHSNSKTNFTEGEWQDIIEMGIPVEGRSGLGFIRLSQQKAITVNRKRLQTLSIGLV